METAAWYRRFADEMRRRSPLTAAWAEGVAADDEVLALIDRLPDQRRQPALVFACARLRGWADASWPELRERLLTRWAEVEAEALVRATQTNEPGRCAALLPALARIDWPLAIIEVGAAAGLCLQLDRYAYRYDGGPVIGGPVIGGPVVGDSRLVLDCATDGAVAPPAGLPQVVWRRGIDRAPLDAADPADAAWLRALLPADEPERRGRLDAALGIAAQDPVVVERGDAVDDLARLVAEVPDDAAPVVVTTGVLAYLPRARRERFREEVRRLGVHWVSLEFAGLYPDTAPAAVPPSDAPFLLALDGHPLAFAEPHGETLRRIPA
ncbi:uncharacterized protein DUF2332 [Diaminobutyricimonas aerilata]|uniref:Uncharacterized protein DUF2332 n=1 Tax=Diaminobutyricimonas aerilata TaxID=1162967 RepID=A0A2M9CM96_9MICO|nr:DUF2332 domain-containing protein [Diaminobutyricimonas aerilata]PJJ73020.1 uncharacterized protein DUF2332 [Diaminobutyricimonas aerilata]